jgi:plasmid stabilization system protein ParE
VKARFIAPAQQELDKAVERYNGKAPGLGEDLASASRKLRDFPELWPKVRGNIRRCRLKRFPFSSIYRADAHEIVVVAVMHHRRRPNYWRSRLKDI